MNLPPPSEWRIIIADRGWVYVGRVGRDGDYLVIVDCHCIRRWGTARGLGELAMRGPQPDTVLDPHGTQRLHILCAVGGELDCDDATWSSWLAEQASESGPARKKRGR